MAQRRSRGTGRPGSPRQDDLQPLVNSALDTFFRLNSGAQIAIIVLLVLIGTAAFLYYRQTHPPITATQGTTPPRTAPAASAAASPNMLLGNPSGATPDPNNKDNYLMIKPYYSLSYNNSAGTPNWVSWRVAREDLGDAPRKQIFDPDTTLPTGFYRVTHKDYSGSGFDRGHMCPHSDRAANSDMSFATFVLTNIIPQAPNVNQKAWANLETYCRNEVSRRDMHLYILAGPKGRGGRGTNGFAESIANGKVTVPSDCWKVIVEVPETAGDDDLAKISPSTRVITVMMPNDNDAVGEDWARFCTTPANVESATGLHFFDRLPAATADALRQKADDTTIPRPRPVSHNRPSE